jgi:AcrR family transcriptional regulator
VPADSREKMVQSATLLIRERGLTGTSFRDVVEHSGAPRGSIYHHFPGGKAELAEEAVALAGKVGRRLVAQPGEASDPVEALRSFIRMWRHTLESTDFRAGCPVVAVATEAGDEAPQLGEAAAAAFESWQRELAAALRNAGAQAPRGRRLAALTVAAVEGAVVLCRASRSSRPLLDVGAELELAIKSALPAAA